MWNTPTFTASLVGVWCALSGLALSGLAADPAAPPPLKARPNVLFCIADDWSWPHAGAYDDLVVKTPNFDRVAREGALFTHAFCAAPSCTPSRGAILTGQYPHRLEQGANLHGFLPSKFQVYPELLEAAGYVVGLTGKGWGPGNVQAGGWTRNPAGPAFKSFEEFLKTVPSDKPFCFWFGSSDPHRPYHKGAGQAAGLKPDDVFVPAYFPDTSEVRNDLLDYYFEVQRFDHDVGVLLSLLDSAGLLDNTLVVVTSDNGMPFPRCKANVYDSGTRVPLAIRWPGKVKAGSVFDDLVNLADLAPTFMEAAGLAPLPVMNGQSLLPLFEGRQKVPRDRVFLERERHAAVRPGNVGYPVRAMRTKEFLFIRNLRPERWPAGDPQLWFAVGGFGDCDNSPTKDFILAHWNEPPSDAPFRVAFERRPPEELYDLKTDPYQTNNIANRRKFAKVQRKLRKELEEWRKTSEDPRPLGPGEDFDLYPYFGESQRMPTRTER
jgi:arylsulfatase A-like enzyme